MSVVVRMEMPENCCECQLRQEDFDTGEEFCPFTGVECLSIGRQNNCPILCQLPEGHGRLVDADAMARDLEYDCELDAKGLDDMTIVGHEREHLQFDKDCKQNCISYLTEQEIIVPAEAERSEP